MKLFKDIPFEWLVGLRYTRAGKRSASNSFISFISMISMSGIALGVAALIIVLSVMNGFEKDVRDRMLSVLAHIQIFDPRGQMPNWQSIKTQVMRDKSVRGAAPFVESQVMLVEGGNLRGAMVRGVLPSNEDEVSDVLKQMKMGSFWDLKPGEFNIVLGSELANNLQVSLGDKVTMLAPQGQLTPAGILPRLKQFTVVGIFSSGYYEFDASMAFVQMSDAEKLFRMSAPSGLRVRINNMLDVPKVAHRLYGEITQDVLISDWTQQNKTWFAAVKTEKTMMFLILTLIVAVAAFNLVSTLVMTVTEKQADIAILRTLGASKCSIMKIFLIQGAVIGILGTAVGVGLGVLVSLNVDVIVLFVESLLHVQFLPSNIYMISTMPSDLRWHDVALISFLSILLAFLATLYPSWSAARVKPAQALRYE